MKKLIFIFALLILVTGCKKDPKPLSSEFDKDKLLEEGKKIITYIDDGDLDKIKESGSELFNEVVTDEDLNKAVNLSNEAGEFVEYGPVEVEGFVDFEEKDMGKVKITAAYSEGIIDYLFLFTKDYKVDSIDLK